MNDSSEKLNILRRYSDINYYPHLLLNDSIQTFLKSNEEIQAFLKKEISRAPKTPNSDLFGFYFVYLIFAAIIFPCIGDESYFAALITFLIAVLYTWLLINKSKLNDEINKNHFNEMKYYHKLMFILNDLNTQKFFINDSHYLRFFLDVYNFKKEINLVKCESKKGVSENYFLKYLFNEFGDENVIINMTINENNFVDLKYSPDFIINISTIKVFIEIDEPYDIIGKSTIHTLEMDLDKNTFYKKNGLIVLRFAEVQVIEEPLYCINLIRCISEILLKNSLSDYNLPNLLSRWNINDVEQMKKNIYRENYLIKKNLLY